ncbi:MAG: hypothetical protein DRZ76_03690 [Candidatus Nealsonbacteria bacterium]|nr:MAG: hypothetical protein DRZ76_03690 [Candidatus Nealsonbacteria bacterium]
MITLILATVCLFSFIGIGVILYRKMPDLVKLPDASPDWRTEVLPKIKKGIERFPGAKNLDHEMYLQKILSKVRVLTLKAESKTSHWLEKLRQRNNRKKNHQPDAYWDELKKSKEGK